MAERKPPLTAAQRAEVKRRARFDTDTAWVLSDPRGRRFVEEFRVAAGIDTPLIPGPNLEYKLGRRSLGIDLTAQVRRVSQPDIFLIMQLERDQAVESEKRAAKAEAPPGEEADPT